MQKDNNFHKIGLFGTTIKDASNKIKKLSDIIEWLEDMDNLYKNGSKKHWWGTDTSSEKGMKCLHDSITKNKLTDVKENSFSSLLNLVVILQDISIGSKKAWRGRTKQPGFQQTLEQCKKTIIEILGKFPSNNTQSIVKINIVKNMNELLENNIIETLGNVFKRNDLIVAGKLKQNILCDLKIKWMNLAKTSLEVKSINEIVNAYTTAFSLDENDVKDIKDVLLLTNTNFKFLDLDDTFSGNISLENIISWMFKLYRKTEEILKKVNELEKSGDLPSSQSDKLACEVVWDKVKKCKCINEKLKCIDKIKNVFESADKKTYLKYLWSVNGILESLQSTLNYSAQSLLDFTSNEARKKWTIIKYQLKSETSKAIYTAIKTNLQVTNDGAGTVYYSEHNVDLRVSNLPSKIEPILEDNKDTLQADTSAQNLIKEFNENYDKTPLIDISGYITK